MAADAPVFDPEPLRRLEASSPGITVAVLGVYQRDLRAVLQQIPDLLRAGDAEAMRRAAHKLKGASAAVGARAVQACALALEQDCRDSGSIPPGRVEELLSAARDLLQLLAAG